MLLICVNLLNYAGAAGGSVCRLQSAVIAIQFGDSTGFENLVDVFSYYSVDFDGNPTFEFCSRQNRDQITSQ